MPIIAISGDSVMAIKPVLTHDKTALAPRIISLERARA
jgi:hypothetical protein